MSAGAFALGVTRLPPWPQAGVEAHVEAVAVAIVAGAISTPLDGSVGRLVLSEDVTSWAAPLPSGADASARIYWASLDVLPPESGGPFSLAIPSTWTGFGLDTLALEAGDAPIAVTLRSWGADGVAYVASQANAQADEPV